MRRRSCISPGRANGKRGSRSRSLSNRCVEGNGKPQFGKTPRSAADQRHRRGSGERAAGRPAGLTGFFSVAGPRKVPQESLPPEVIQSLRALGYLN